MCVPKARLCASLAGATSGGAALVVRSAAGIAKPEDFHGKKIATPQLATRRTSLCGLATGAQLETRDKGGDVLVIPIANPDQLTLFLKGKSTPLGARTVGFAPHPGGQCPPLRG